MKSSLFLIFIHNFGEGDFVFINFTHQSPSAYNNYVKDSMELRAPIEH